MRLLTTCNFGSEVQKWLQLLRVFPMQKLSKNRNLRLNDYVCLELYDVSMQWDVGMSFDGSTT